MMTIDELLKENEDVLIRMKNEGGPDPDWIIRKIAFDCWNFDTPIPTEYISQVIEYIRNHPQEFRGLVPQGGK